jgi:hypothetical protein
MSGVMRAKQAYSDGESSRLRANHPSLIIIVLKGDDFVSGHPLEVGKDVWISRAVPPDRLLDVLRQVAATDQV